jgi:hypothetical protein
VFRSAGRVNKGSQDSGVLVPAATPAKRSTPMRQGASMRVKKRNPFLAAVLSILLPGLGQLYGGRPRRSVAIIGLALILAAGGKAIAALAAQAQSNAGMYTYVALLIAAVGLWVFALVGRCLNRPTCWSGRSGGL